MKKQKTMLRYAAAAIFIFSSVIGAYLQVLIRLLELNEILQYFGLIVIAIGLIMRSRTVCCVGAGIRGLVGLWWLVCYGGIAFIFKWPDRAIRWITSNFTMPYYHMRAFFPILMLVAFLLMFYNVKIAKIVAAISGTDLILAWILFRSTSSISGFSIAAYILPAIGAILIVLCMEEIATAGDNLFPAPKSAVPSVGSQIEQLVALKNLLDKNIITQEEFEVRKKEILGR